MEYFSARIGSPEVLLFQPSWLPETEFQQRLPYRLAPIVSALLDAGYSVRLLEEARGDRPTAAWRPWFESSVATVVWCGEMYPGHQIHGILQLQEILRGIGRGLVVGGGFFPLLDVTRLHLDPAIRAVIVGPGEIVLPQVVDALAEEHPLQELEGVVVFEDGRAIGPARPSRLRMHRDTELRALDGFALETRAHPEPRIFGNAEPALQLPTGSGCAKRCPFCFDERTPYRIFAAEAVVAAIDRARARSGVSQFLLGELDFFHGKTRALRVAEGLADLAVPVKWFALGSVCDLATFDDAQLARLARSGCVRIELGSESGADSSLRRLGKRHTAELILPLAQRLWDHGIATTHNFLFGTPDETDLERLATARLALEIKARVPRAHFNLRVFQIVPATTFGERVLRGRESEFPSTLEQLRDYRQEALSNGRTLPWLEPADEHWVKHLVSYILPLALDEHFGGPPHPAFAWAARLRARHGWRAFVDVEQRSFERSRRTRVCETYVA